MEMLHTPANGKAMPIVVRALGKLGDSRLVDTLLPLVARPEREIRIEAIQALSRVADESRAEQVRNQLQAQVSCPDPTLSRMAAAAMNELENRLAGVTPLAGTSAGAVAATQAGVRPPHPLAPGGAQTKLDPGPGGTQGAEQGGADKLHLPTLHTGRVISRGHH